MKQQKWINFLKKHQLALIGMVIGALGGYAYYYFIGCSSGSCSITSSPLNSTLYGSLMGALLLSMFKKEKANNNHSKNAK